MNNIILILGANTLQLPLIKKANDIGYQTLVVSPNNNEPGHRIAAFSEVCDVTDAEGVLAIAKRFDICGIITDQTDLPVRTMAYVSGKMGLPGNDYEAAHIFTDKYLMREKCKEIGIKTVEYKLCHSLSEAKKFYESVNKEIIIKPVDNQGSKGVSKITSLNELTAKFDEAIVYSRSKSVLAEEYIYGQEFLVEGICVNYEFKNLCCGDTEYFDIPDVFSASKREFPSTAPKETVDKVLAANEKIVKGFGLKQGITHAEYIMNGEDVVLLEIAARGGGVFISSDLIHLQTGLDTEEFLLNIATGKIDKIPSFSSKNQSCCYISFFLPEGTVTSIKGIDKVKSLPYTYHNNFDDLYIGKRIEKSRDKTSRFFVIVSAENHAALMSRCTIIRQTIDVEVVNQDGQKRGIIWG